jgi:hypothetical protein
VVQVIHKKELEFAGSFGELAFKIQCAAVDGQPFLAT